MSNDPPPNLEDLDKRLETLKKKVRPERGEHTSKAEGWNIVVDLFAGPIIGLFVGMGLDKLLGSIPAFTLLFFILGFCASLLKIIRTAVKKEAQQNEQDKE